MTAGKGPLRYTTAVPVSRTTGACLTLLAEAGASAVAVTYTDKIPSGLMFSLDTPVGSRDFRLPVNIDGVHAELQAAHQEGRLKRSGGRSPDSFASRKHAVDVAWRVVKDWLEAQLAIIAAHMAALDEVMLPYLQVEPGRTLYQVYRENEERALEAGGAP